MVRGARLRKGGRGGLVGFSGVGGLGGRSEGSLVVLVFDGLWSGFVYWYFLGKFCVVVCQTLRVRGLLPGIVRRSSMMIVHFWFLAHLRWLSGEQKIRHFDSYEPVLDRSTHHDNTRLHTNRKPVLKNIVCMWKQKNYQKNGAFYVSPNFIIEF